ncbi:MAG: hypothetical protein MJ033_07920 [Victivallaceae bacterium]|nr:hypothetical protein [Victivallaceae bacterium]
MPNKKDAVPKWFKYDAEGDLDVDATLTAAPAVLDEKCAFFRDVPPWYEVTDLSEVDETIEQLQNATPEEKGDTTDDEITEMLINFRRLRSYIEVYQRVALSDVQKKIVRAMCYWASVKTMAEIPGADED